jgi:hypothetical protein
VVATHDSSIAVPKSKFVLYSQADAQSGQIHLLSDVEGCQLHLDKLEHSADFTILLPVDSCQKNLIGVKNIVLQTKFMLISGVLSPNLELYPTITTLS